MAGLFAVLFLVAIVGVFKPYINGVKRWHFGVAAFACFMAVGLFPETNVKTAPALAGATPGQTSESPGTIPKPSSSTSTESASGSHWSYRTQEDKMRNGIAHFAEVQASETVNLDFPYGEQRPSLTIRQDPKYGFDIYFGVDSGQILCNNFSSTHVSAKFDNGPVERFECTSASDGTSNVAFIQSNRRFLSQLRLAKKLIMEVEFYNNGRKQVTFDVANLEWK